MARLGPKTLFRIHKRPVIVEIFSQRPSVGVEEPAFEQVNDCGRAGQPLTFTSRLKPSQTCLQKMHMRIGAAWAAAASCLTETAMIPAGEISVYKVPSLGPKRLSILVSQLVRMRCRKQNAGMVIEVLSGIGDPALRVNGARPAAIFGARRGFQEVHAMRHQPCRITLPAHPPCDGKRVELARDGAQAFWPRHRLALKRQRLVKTAIDKINAFG